MKRIPESMRSELGAWNNGKGIDLESWVGCMGSFALAVGYADILWPRFVKFRGYILREGFSKQSLRGFETNGDACSVEAVMNHLHLADIQHYGSKDLTKDKLIRLGQVLKEVYEAKLEWQFPDDPCTVLLYRPKKADDLMEYQITFWQKKNEKRRSTRRSSLPARLRHAGG